MSEDQAPEAAAEAYAHVRKVGADTYEADLVIDLELCRVRMTAVLAGVAWAEGRAGVEILERARRDQGMIDRAYAERDEARAEVERLVRSRDELLDVERRVTNTLSKDREKWRGLAKKLAGALERQQHPHVEQFCRERAREALTEFEKAKNESEG